MERIFKFYFLMILEILDRFILFKLFFERLRFEGGLGVNDVFFEDICKRFLEEVCFGVLAGSFLYLEL